MTMIWLSGNDSQMLPQPVQWTAGGNVWDSSMGFQDDDWSCANEWTGHVDPQYSWGNDSSNAQQMQWSGVDQTVELDRGNPAPSTSNVDGPLIPKQLPADQGKLVVVLDLDETLVRFREGPVFWRPHMQAFLDSIKKVCEVVLWTASTEECATRVMGDLDPHGDRIHHKVFRTDKWFKGVPYTKELTLLGRDMSRIVILENTVECVTANPGNAIIVPDYIQPDSDDAALLVAREACLAMAQEGVDVPTYLRSSAALLPLYYHCGRVAVVGDVAQRHARDRYIQATKTVSGDSASSSRGLTSDDDECSSSEPSCGSSSTPPGQGQVRMGCPVPA